MRRRGLTPNRMTVRFEGRFRSGHKAGAGGRVWGCRGPSVGLEVGLGFSGDSLGHVPNGSGTLGPEMIHAQKRYDMPHRFQGQYFSYSHGVCSVEDAGVNAKRRDNRNNRRSRVSVSEGMRWSPAVCDCLNMGSRLPWTRVHLRLGG